MVMDKKACYRMWSLPVVTLPRRQVVGSCYQQWSIAEMDGGMSVCMVCALCHMWVVYETLVNVSLCVTNMVRGIHVCLCNMYGMD